MNDSCDYYKESPKQKSNASTFLERNYGQKELSRFGTEIFNSLLSRKILSNFERKEELKAVARNEWLGLFSHLWSWGVNFLNPKYLECASLSKIFYRILYYINSKSCSWNLFEYLLDVSFALVFIFLIYLFFCTYLMFLFYKDFEYVLLCVTIT